MKTVQATKKPDFNEWAKYIREQVVKSKFNSLLITSTKRNK